MDPHHHRLKSVGYVRGPEKILIDLAASAFISLICQPFPIRLKPADRLVTDEHAVFKSRKEGKYNQIYHKTASGGIPHSRMKMDINVN